tara:strand:- start:1142 stop:2413 length:1272 start_codon:yes stop_codon:yes gene_type:complete
MQIEVDNEILAALIDAHFGVKHKISLNSEKKNITEGIFIPQDKCNSKILNSVTLDTYGIINKSKLFTREPITGEQIIYLINDISYPSKSNNPDIKIETTDYRNFYKFEIKDIKHKYCSSIFTNLKYKKINIVFPNDSTIHFFSENLSLIKKYVKKIANKKIQESDLIKIKVPTNLSILYANENSKDIFIKNKSYLGICFELVNLLSLNMLDEKSIYNSSNNNNYYINILFFNFYNFFPKFISLLIFKFLLRFNKCYIFSNQVLEINNNFNKQNNYFSNIIDDNQYPSYLSKGTFFPNIKLNNKKHIHDLLENDDTYILSDKYKLKNTINVILLSEISNKNTHQISKSSYDYLNLDKCYYIVDNHGLITTVDIVDNIGITNVSDSNLKYSDNKQSSIDNFYATGYEPSLPKLKLPKIWPFKSKI